MSYFARAMAPVKKATEPVGTAMDGLRDWWGVQRGPVRWSVYLLLILAALYLPSQDIGSFMSPYSDWQSLLFYPIGGYVLLAIGLNVVVGQAGLLDLGY